MPREGNERIEQIFGAQVVLQKLAAVRAVVLVEPHAEIAVCLLPREGIESIHAVDDHEAVPLAAVLIGDEEDAFGVFSTTLSAMRTSAERTRSSFV